MENICSPNFVNFRPGILQIAIPGGDMHQCVTDALVFIIDLLLRFFVV